MAYLRLRIRTVSSSVFVSLCKTSFNHFGFQKSNFLVLCPLRYFVILLVKKSKMQFSRRRSDPPKCPENSHRDTLEGLIYHTHPTLLHSPCQTSRRTRRLLFTAKQLQTELSVLQDPLSQLQSLHQSASSSPLPFLVTQKTEEKKFEKLRSKSELKATSSERTYNNFVHTCNLCS